MMLSKAASSSSFTGEMFFGVGNQFLTSDCREQNICFHPAALKHLRAGASNVPCYFSEEQPMDQSDPELDDAARGERDYVRQRLREELGREPSEEEIDEWLRQHTEGY